MKRLGVAGLVLAAILLPPAHAGAAAKPQASTVKLTAHPVWTVAMDWPRVAYATGKDGNSEAIHVWNVATGATSVVKSTKGFATHHTTQIAIAGKQLVWIRTVQFGNTELDHWLYTAPLGGSAHLLRRMLGYTDTDCGLGGPQMGGLVASGQFMAVSTWTESSDGSVSSNQRLSLITPKRLRAIATGPDAILSESADGDHIAVLPVPPPSLAEGYCESSLPTSAVIYSTDGTLLKTIALPPPDPSTLGYQLAFSGKELVVLTDGLYEPNGPAWVTLTVYHWTTGTVLHTWPVAIRQYPGEVNFTVHGELAAVEGPFRLHLVDLNTGKDVTLAAASHTVSPTALGARGLVYAVNPHNTGKLVFVPMAKLLAMVGRQSP
jgi:hypothetical protein